MAEQNHHQYKRGSSEGGGSHPTSHEHTIKDEEWLVIQRAMSGDPGSREHLFDRHERRLYRTAFSIVRNKEDAEDALQDAFCRACAGLGLFRGKSSFSTWLHRIVINSSLTILRRRATHREQSLDEILDNEPVQWPSGIAETRRTPETICSIREIQKLVNQEINRLPAAMRIAIQLGGLWGMSGRESSRMLGIPKNTFKSQSFRARRKLAVMLRQSLGIEVSRKCDSGTEPEGCRSPDL